MEVGEAKPGEGFASMFLEEAKLPKLLKQRRTLQPVASSSHPSAGPSEGSP